jgi:hypothetical protein
MVSLFFEKWTFIFLHVFALNDENWVGFGWVLYVVTKVLLPVSIRIFILLIR